MRSRLRLASLGPLVLVWGLLGCARKAPGPEECHALALRWVAAELPPARGPASLARVQELERRVLERARTCLTVPFDRELVRCVANETPPPACFRQFAAREGENR